MGIHACVKTANHIRLQPLRSKSLGAQPTTSHHLSSHITFPPARHHPEPQRSLVLIVSSPLSAKARDLHRCCFAQAQKPQNHSHSLIFSLRCLP